MDRVCRRAPLALNAAWRANFNTIRSLQTGRRTKLTEAFQPFAGLHRFSSLSIKYNDHSGTEKPTYKRGATQRKADDRPWHRESSKALPKSTSPDPTGGDEKKGRLLTTPTRLLKLILPIPFHPEQEYINAEDPKNKWNNEPVEPLALLIHPHQPLSYLERLIQAEIPPLKVKGGEKLPEIVFRAEADYSGGKEGKKAKDSQESNGSNVASYSGLGHEGPSKNKTHWVRWSGSTEIGDFIRDAARGREFTVSIEGHHEELRVAVPSFKDRTYYLRMRLRRMSHEIDQMARVKRECDLLAHKGAHTLAKGGFAALASWWGIVYYVTFHTEMGWDLVEPVTYLAGLTTIMGGYLWFLFISRDLSYKAAMNITVSRRQNALYQERGFDQQRWDQVVHDANALRREIKIAAQEYGVDWDEMKDLGGEEVKEALEEEKNSKKKTRDEEEDEEDDEPEEDEGHSKQKDPKSKEQKSAGSPKTD
ncbi:hypothetical protein QQS21_008828 [Conoideocrella luteorostrata]|uniref:Calcium uniporter protein n=1 Tax=Conoideocrella luteorostrata TaxID=1105319 RepID=A0AAJ0CIB9_9HYPO|nr:hypothetical protein QQS21_008828 [Conoideocrella luteorostrata]